MRSMQLLPQGLVMYLIKTMAIGSWLMGCGGGGKSAQPGPTDGSAMDLSPALCSIPERTSPDWAKSLCCEADYRILASEPFDTSIPGATSVKTVVDRMDKNALYFQNSKRYCIHWDFASAHLSGGTHPLVSPLAQFNATAL